MYSEILELLDDAQKKMITDALTKKFVEAINQIDVADFNEDIKEAMNDTIKWCIGECDIDTDGIGNMISGMIKTALHKCYKVGEEND